MSETPVSKFNSSGPQTSSIVSRHQGCFETLLNVRGRFPGLSLHLERFKRGCDLLNIPVPIGFESTDNLRNELSKRILENTEHQKVRWQIWKNATPSVFQHEITVSSHLPSDKPVVLCLSDFVKNPISLDWDSCKWNDRRVYEDAQKQADKMGADQPVLFTNEGNIAETSVANIWIENDSVWMTPPVENGILPGIGSQILKTFFVVNKIPFIENRITLTDLTESPCILLTNSLHPLRTAVLEKGRKVTFPPWFHDYRAFYEAFAE